MPTTTTPLECDRYGVPAYSGSPDQFEEYTERAWDLFYGREGGTDGLQVATPLHLRAQLTGSAYEAVRKLSHEKLRTKNGQGKATEAGMRLLLQTLKESIAVEQPVKINELFLGAFYSPQVWRRNDETMAQYIVRRENDFSRLKEVSDETQVSTNIRCLLLLLFSGLDSREQQAVLASVGNEYDFKKVSHALRIQYPAVMSRPVQRRDLLGSGRGSASSAGSPFQARLKWKTQVQGRTKHALLADGGEEEVYYEEDEDDAYFEDEEAADHAEGPDDALVNYSDDETLDALLGELPPDALEDSSLADAFATVAQFKQKGKGGGKKPSQPAGIPFRASGDITFEQKAKEQRKSAVKFLKAVTFCTACEKKGHWAGDPECSKSVKKGKGRGSPVKKKINPSSKKKPSNVMFVLHDRLESDDEALLQDTFEASPNDKVLDEPEALKFDVVPEANDVFQNDSVPVDGETVKNDEVTASNEAEKLGEEPATSFTNYVDTTSRQHEVFMVLKDTSLCEHSVYFGGNERQYHRGANGHTRHIRCREPDCNSTVILARRKEPAQLWKYLTLIALCTKWGKEARSRELAQSVAKQTLLALEDAAPPLLSLKDEPKAAKPPPAGWSLVESERNPDGKKGYKGGEAASSTSDAKPLKARIVYEPEMQAWLYGIHLALEVELPPFPELAGDDLKILQPLPTDDTLLTTGPLAGLTFVVASSCPEYEWWCRNTLAHALDNEPMIPEIFRFAFYLYGRVQLVRSAAIQMMKSGASSQSKRPSDSGMMSTTRSMQVPLQMRRDDPRSLETRFCDVMMVNEQRGLEVEDALSVMIPNMMPSQRLLMNFLSGIVR